MRNGPFGNAVIMSYIDSLVTVLDQPQQRNFTKWPILDEYIWPNNYVGNTYANEINYLKNWVSARLAWLDTNIAGLEVITGLEAEDYVKSQISIYPNPNNGKFHIRLNEPISSDLDFRLYDKLGKMIRNEQLASNHPEDHLVNIGHVSRGIYIVKISDHKKLIHTEKIIVY